MKTKLLTFSLLSLLIFGMATLTSCSKDDDGNNNDMDCNNCYTYTNGGDPQTVTIEYVKYYIDGENLKFFFANETMGNDIILSLDQDTDYDVIPEGTFTQETTPSFTWAFHSYGLNDNSYSVDGINRKITIAKVVGGYKINFEFTSGVGLTKGNYTGLVEN